VETSESLSLRGKAVSLQEAARLADQKTTVELSLALLWRELSLGLCRVVDGFFTDSRCYLVTRSSDGGAPAIAERRRKILEAILSGEGQKRVAIELNLAPSTIAFNAREALVELGASCKPSRAHPLLMLAAHAARSSNRAVAGALSFFSHDESTLRVVSLERPELCLSGRIPPGELAVVRCLVEGRSYLEIAGGRGTSTRTIANQLASVFRRLQVSGRGELLIRLLTGSGDPAWAPASRREPIAPGIGLANGPRGLT
jgi:DNA-binding NarL/FixJ family response regulator